MPATLFFSHDHRDSKLATIIGQAISRITLGQIEVWSSSDQSPSGGIQPGEVWLDKIRRQLQQSKAVIALLTPISHSKPWILFESGFGAAHVDCEVIPLCIGINPQNDVPFPLAMYQCYQLADYESLSSFAAKLLAKYEVKFDAEMAQPVLRQAIKDLTVASKWEAGKPEINLLDVSEGIKQHIDRRFMELVGRWTPEATGTSQETVRVASYTVPILISFPDFKREQFLEIEDTTTVGTVLDNIYFMLEDKVDPFTYLEDWKLRDQNSGLNLIVREVADKIPAKFIFTPDSRWEVLKLDKPYDPRDRGDANWR